MMEARKHKIAFLISHPIQYYTPFFKKLSEHPQVDLTVYFCLQIGHKEHFDPGFNTNYKWDIPLLEGYAYKFLKNYSPKPAPTLFGQINPGIIRELKKNKYDAMIIHGYTACTNILALLGAWLTKTPIILKGEAVLPEKERKWKKMIKKIILWYVFKRVQAVLYAYKANKDFFRFYGVPEEKLFFYPSAVDNEFFQKKRKELKGTKQLIKRKAGLKHANWPIILFVGKFIVRKRVMDLLQAVAKLKQKVNMNVLLIGDGVEKETLTNFVKKNNLENVYFKGFKNQSELPTWYSVANVFVLPSAFDPSPKAMNEAMNFGLPVVVTDEVKTASDMVVENNAGFVYQAGNVDELASCIEKIVKDSSLRAKLGKNALMVMDKWNFSNDIKGIIEAVNYIYKV
ncbi:hypothetical protein A3A21_01385 [Candidatus Jorgensenbacteria bacterium RIFCSPLOWO2_01_FULL_45_25b]|uniref:Glycosyl transferase family 1 domain-containing protein n=1 Tax=Candidatus Jorgensenbacteria bacterium RIFCSPLOWO2_01_FULL_45_25b TaxID=1798471 RepID=A0A1F6BVD1_9BACT|nr:MAG: hypothetical protein A3A21_01385 [Candidatus Jorgensenbacteria bacterium RIFCSPLOWO2_01_FULL_45_25b]